MHRCLTLLVVCLAVACSRAVPSPARSPSATQAAVISSMQELFPATNAIQGWTASQAVQEYDRSNVFRLVDGQADYYFTYGFRRVAVQRYENADGTRLDVEVWQLATPADAYGLFTSVASAAPADTGNEGDLESGRRLSFWQDHYTVHVSARQTVQNSILFRFANAIALELPPGGEKPALVHRLPQAGLQERGYVFFREELAIQDRVYLGGKNLLGLSHDTDGIVAQYDLGGLPARLLLIEYPTAEQANAGVTTLQSGTVKDLVSIKAKGNLLGAVFGKGGKAQADQLLDGAMRSE